MRNGKKLVSASFLVLLLVAFAPQSMATFASAEEALTLAAFATDENWYYIQNDAITIKFLRNGTKPMFLWWYTNEPNNINVVKFKGLVEYFALETPYFLWKCMSEPWRIRERIEARLPQSLKQNAFDALRRIGNKIGLHRPYLPFSGCEWSLDGPVNVTRGDVKYLSFNFTLVDVPGWKSGFQFAEHNIILRCRFYYTPATEDVYGKYAYTVDAGELKIDIVIKHWEWNIDELEPIIKEIRDLGFNIPKYKAGLALWVNLASINMTELGTAKQDMEDIDDVDLVEGVSMAKNMYVEGTKVSVFQNDTGNDEAPLGNSWRERFRIRLEKGNTTFAGFFKFVPQAIVTDGVVYNTTDVTASYISAGNHMRLFIGYPYFGNNTLEHDPSLGIENIASWLPVNSLILLIGVTAIIGVAIAAIRLKKKTVNIVSMQ